MKKNVYAVTICIGLLFSCAAGHAADSYSRAINLYKKAPQAKPFFDSAYAYAVFPVMGKGAFLIGGAFGEGRMYQGGQVTGSVSQANFSLGMQVGGQAFSEIIFLQDKRAYDEFTNGAFEFESKVSAVAVTAGVQAQAGTGGNSASASAGPSTTKQFAATYVKGMAVLVHVHGGLMVEAAVGGQVFEFKPLRK